MNGLKRKSFNLSLNIDPLRYEPRTYYSQNREDLILSAFFPDIKKGFYVDVGGYDPDYDSVTKKFYKEGWSGINIEPQPDRHKKFLVSRKRDINLNIGISDRSGELTLRSYSNQGLSTFSSVIKEEYSILGVGETSTYTDLSVSVKTLEQVFDENGVKSIQFLKIDVEGLETEVIKGNDWKRYRPEVVCVEQNHAKSEWRDILLQNDYTMCFDDGLNSYYTDNKTDRAKIFDYVDYVVIGRSGGIKIEDLETIQDLREEAQNIRELLLRADIELTSKSDQIQRLLSSQQSFSGIIKIFISWAKNLFKHKR